MDLSELEKKVSRLMPRRLKRSREGVVSEDSGVKASPKLQAETAKERQPIKRSPRVPQALKPVLNAPVAEVELVPAELEPGARDARNRLLEHGASPALAERVVRSILASGARGAYAIDAAADVLGRTIRFAAAPRMADAPHLLFFVGPTGGGKTATLAKLGRKLCSAGRDVLFATLDPFSVNGFGNGRGPGADIDRTELPLEAVRDAKGLQELFRKRGGADLILLDTPGLSCRDQEGLEEFAQTLLPMTKLGQAHVYLVLPASSSRSALALSAQAFAGVAPTAAVITKLDETTEPGTALEEAQRAGLPLSFLCDGQDVRGHLIRANQNRVADLFLRGKLA